MTLKSMGPSMPRSCGLPFDPSRTQVSVHWLFIDEWIQDRRKKIVWIIEETGRSVTVQFLGLIILLAFFFFFFCVCVARWSILPESVGMVFQWIFRLVVNTLTLNGCDCVLGLSWSLSWLWDDSQFNDFRTIFNRLGSCSID